MSTNPYANLKAAFEYAQHLSDRRPDRPAPVYTGRLLATASEDPHGPGVNVWVHRETEGERRCPDEVDVTHLLRDGEDWRDMDRRLNEALPPIDLAAMLAEAIERLESQHSHTPRVPKHVRDADLVGDSVGYIWGPGLYFAGRWECISSVGFHSRTIEELDSERGPLVAYRVVSK
ncbi:MAG: hypothetical protein L0G99_09165 [Propionibacteriales bacterium]|nr:hypothetical protein [Propionibacteriales bacterium]